MVIAESEKEWVEMEEGTERINGDGKSKFNLKKKIWCVYILNEILFSLKKKKEILSLVTS